MNKINRSLIALAATLVLSPLAHAQKSAIIPSVRKAEGMEQMKPSIGFWGGYAQTESRRDATTFGADYTFQQYIPFSFGAEVLGMVARTKDTTSVLTRTRVLAKASYNFGGDIIILKNTYVSLGLGPVFDNESGTLDTRLGIVPAIGMDFMLGESGWSAGVNFGYMFLTAGNQSFTANGVMKYWF